MSRQLSRAFAFDLTDFALKSMAAAVVLGAMVVASGLWPLTMLEAAPPDEPKPAPTPHDTVDPQQTAAIDPITEELFRTYVAVAGKIPTASVNAAIELVGERGAGNLKFRETVIQEFEKSCDNEQASTVRRNLLKLMRKMLAKEGAMRWQQEESQRTGAINQSAAAPLVDPKLLYDPSKMLDRVIARGRQASRSEIDAFVLAIRESHHPQAKPFLFDVLRNPESKNPVGSEGSAVARGKWPDNVGGTWRDAKFHAAVALAELGEREGVEWLIDQARPNEFGIDGHVFGAAHARAVSGSLRENCRYALADLSGLQPENGFDPLITWWAARKGQFTPKPVALRME